ncbi:MAG: hypothetical protein DRI57_14825, partial [Deltaproteobacteria bacterium]
SSLGDYVWYDSDMDGVQDPNEQGVAGVLVELLTDAQDTVVETTVTDGSGFYEFTGLPAGTYKVRFTTLPGYEFTFSDRGTGILQDVFDSDADVITGETAEIMLTGGEHNPTLDAGIFIGDTLPASLGNRVWEDLNQNGIQDADESGVTGVKVNLLTSDLVLLASTRTDASGFYEFAGLKSGDYVVEFKLRPQDVFTSQDQGDDEAVDSDPSTASSQGTGATGRTEIVTLLAGEHNPRVDAGIYVPNTQLASLGDLVWYDEDQDGIQDENEPGVFSVEVRVYDSAGTVLGTTFTDTDGFYEFTGLTPGDYALEFVAPLGYEFALQDQEDDDSLDSDANPTTGRTIIIPLNAGDAVMDADAGLNGPNLINLGDLVWLDQNGDGALSDSEGLSGVLLNLYNGEGRVLGSTETDENGNYTFPNLPAGDYRVEVDVTTLSRKATPFADPDEELDSLTDVIGQTGDNTDLDFGYLGKAASLGDYVWYDTDQNGIQDAEEPGIAGVAVTLLDPVTDAVIAETVTDASGFYEFRELAADSYRIEFALPAGGYVFSPQNEGTGELRDIFDSDPPSAGSGTAVTGRTGTVLLVSGQHDPSIDAGMYIPGTVPASLGDRVWYDSDQNGIQDSEEPGIAGVRVFLTDLNTGMVTDEVITDGQGLYRFRGLIPGDYQVRYELPAGYEFTPQNQGTDDASDSDPHIVTGRTGKVTLSSGEDNLTVDAGMVITGGRSPASLGDFVWYDANRNGIQDPAETGVPGVTVNLSDSTGNFLISTTHTDVDGYYRFDGLAPGDYVLEFRPLEEYSITSQHQGDEDDSDSDPDPDTGRTPVIRLETGTSIDTVDAGLLYSGLNVIDLGYLVWLDKDGDGMPSADEGLPNVTLRLHDGQGLMLVSTDTDENGNYLFPNLPAGNYRITVDTDTLPDDAAAFSDPDGVLDSLTDIVDQSSDYLDADFGYRLSHGASLGDHVWYDSDQDGVQDPGESGIPDVIINLTDPATNNIIGTTLTDETGHYEFTDLFAGDYIVEFETPDSSYVFTSRDQGSSELQDAFDSDADVLTGRTEIIRLSPGEHLMLTDAGMYVPDTGLASLGDFVWYDSDDDGIQDADESGITGVFVNLLLSDLSLVSSTLTDGSGRYTFTTLVPGDYVVEFILPPGYEFSPHDQGDNDASDSDAHSGTGQTETITLSQGENDLSADAGMVILGITPAHLGDFVWYDADQDGIQDADERGVPGILVNLFNAPGTKQIGTAVTNGDGIYEFTGLTPGSFMVEFELPPGYHFTSPDQGTDDESDSDPSVPELVEGGRTDIIRLDQGDALTDIDAGIFVRDAVTFSDIVWLDENGDGEASPGEGIPGVTLRLYDSHGNVVAKAVTNENGEYVFSAPPGDYRIAVDTNTLPGTVAENFADPDGVPDSLTDILREGDIPSDLSFGYRPATASLGDTVWYDSDQDGIRDLDEPGIAGAPVRLLSPATDEVIAETVTDGHGSYIFADLTPDEYVVEFELPGENYVFSPQDQGTALLQDAFDSDADTVTGRTRTVTLSPGENDMTMDAGMFIPNTGPAGLGDFV